MMSAIDELAANAVAHEADFEGQRAVIPTKHITLVTCMDSRIDTFRIFGLVSGEAHILRNAGGLVTDDMLRSLVLSQRLLQTREVILMHHTNCGLHNADENALRDTRVMSSTSIIPDSEVAASPPAIMPCTIPGGTLKVGAHSDASRTPRRPLVPAPM